MEHHFNIDIANDFGIEEAIILHSIFFWLSKNASNNKHFYDGLYWFYNSKKAFVEMFPYMNETKIFRLLKNLEEKGIIAKGNYSKDKWNKTNWYALTKNGIDYMVRNGYKNNDLQSLLQNDTIERVKMNDGACQNERCINNYYTDIDTNSNKEEDIIISSKKKAQKSDEPIVLSPEMQEVVDKWLQYKKEKGQSYKPTGFNSFCKKLCKLSNNNPQVAMAIIEESMSNNYAGIFPLRNNNNNNNYGRETITDKIRRTIADAEQFQQKLDASIEEADLDFGDTDEPW